MLVYASLKAAQTSMVRNLARQFAPRGVTVNNLAPGVIATDRNTERLAAAAYREQVLARIPAGRIGDPDDCAGAALLLCSEAGRYITGQSLLVDGGMSL
jgi:NAD(P)-dependent dehydrogenase (short-subunit alcohol dehydrogenase family)